MMPAVTNAASPLQLEIKHSDAYFALGKDAPQLSSGLRAEPLGALSIQTGSMSWRYGAAVGKVDHSSSTTINYGANAARAWMDMDLSPRLSIDGLYQRDHFYQKLGIGGHYHLGRWGEISASYSGAYSRFGQKQHALGVSQQLWYSSNLRVDVDAQRQLHSGDYNVGLRFSLPMF